MSLQGTRVNTIVVGAGQAGLAMSRCLQRENIEHVVFERDTVGSSWRSRWDSFHLNTPSRINCLPEADAIEDPGGFLGRDRWVSTLEVYQRKHGLPIRCGVEVRALRPGDGDYSVETQEGVFHAENVVLCSGDQNVPRIPGLAAALPADIKQFHGAHYRSATALPQGAVLVVGSAQTGTQIVEDLLEAGRTVWLCTSKVGRVPRRYRGRDITDWLEVAGMAEQRPDEVPDEERNARQGMISGTHGGHSISLHSLAHAGARLLGKLVGVEGRRLRLADNLMENVAKGDEGVAKLRLGLNTFIENTGLDAPPAEHDPADTPHSGLQEMAAVRELDLDEQDIRTVIWATGFGGDFSYLPPELLDDRGMPTHEAGVCQPGLYCLGLVWQRRRFSGLIAGVAGDAEYILEHLKSAGRTGR